MSPRQSPYFITLFAALSVAGAAHAQEATEAETPAPSDAQVIAETTDMQASSQE